MEWVADFSGLRSLSHVGYAHFALYLDLHGFQPTFSKFPPFTYGCMQDTKKPLTNPLEAAELVAFLCF
ncbi:MAG: hypothetical protein R3F41_17630 [Gammaproteobacteria bacterium]|nr:hypothetical protein [Pseudomonadales bacterium]